MTTPQSTPAPETTQEEWRPIVGYEGLYEVSHLGRVRRCSTGQILKRGYSKRPYPYVALCKHSIHRKFRIHRLVAAAFLGPCPTGFVCHHKDDNKGNPRADNLTYVTPSENTRLAVDSVTGTRRFKAGRKLRQCKNGHPYDENNSYITAAGHQKCRICRREQERSKYLRGKARK